MNKPPPNDKRSKYPPPFTVYNGSGSIASDVLGALMRPMP